MSGTIFISEDVALIYNSTLLNLIRKNIGQRFRERFGSAWAKEDEWNDIALNAIDFEELLEDDFMFAYHELKKAAEQEDLPEVWRELDTAMQKDPRFKVV